MTMWFDPGCPFTWRTSRWLRATAADRGDDITWRLMSLAALREGSDEEVPEPYKGIGERARLATRVLAAVADRYGNDGLDRAYTAFGTRNHDQGRDYGPDLFREALAEAGLPAELADAAGDTSLDATVRASHDEGQKRVGQDSGSPVLAAGDGPGFFGPVLTGIPTGDEAQRLYDAFLALSAVPEFSELKRAR